MKYNFDQVIDRKNTNSLKYDFAAEWGKPKELLSLWVADMDFSAPPEVLEDIHRAVAHGIFGYSEAKEDYYQRVIHWFRTRFGWTFDQEDVVKSPGVVVALAQCVRAFTRQGDSILIQTPVYYPFYFVIKQNQRKLVTNSLRYENGTYHIDFEDFEKKIRDNQVKMFILCSPHNPVGRVWRQEELQRMNAICEEYGVLVVSDEIHCDFVNEGQKHTCFGLLNENTVIATAPSKTFNLAGLQASNIIVKNPELRRLLTQEMHKSGYSHLNTLGMIACQSAYTKGGEWLSALKQYLAENVQLVKAFLAENLPKIQVTEPEGTYLMWLNFAAYGLPQKELDKRMVHGAKLWLSSGTLFGAEGEGFQRVNIACPKATLEEALKRLYEEFKER